MEEKDNEASFCVFPRVLSSDNDKQKLPLA